MNKKKVSVNVLRDIAAKLRVMYAKKPKTARTAQILALIGRFEKRTDPIRRIEDYGGYFKYAMRPPGFQTQLKPDTLTKMRSGWLVDAAKASLKRKATKRG